ncbi:MAG: IS1634 family transposase [Desulfobacteraceae bacterium]|nr:IS1634 family transposase [Desulfobacteraceae bacterium]MBC2718314.1 IS1634 family transposase [Desulfobacteraceae bacterium]
MFFRNNRSKNSKLPVLQLVENIRTARGPRVRIVVSLGTKFKIPKSDRSAVARIVKERLSGQLSLFSYDAQLVGHADYIVKKIQTEGKWDSARQRVSEFKESGRQTAEIFVEDVEHGYTRELGPILIGDTFWNRLNFPSILREYKFRESEIKTAEIAVLNRLISQDSENGIIPWLWTVAIDELLGIDFMQFGHDRFYRISDKLLKYQSYIEEELYQREKDLFSLEDCIFLYDLTNTYFEGVCARNPKAKYSKNQKEKRSDCPQVVVALVLDGDGFIRRHRVFEGKMSDSKSLDHIVEELEKEFSDKSMPTIIFDRGMVTEENIELLKSYGNLKYIVMCRSNEEKQFIGTFQREEFHIVEGRDPKKKVEVMIKPSADIVYLLCKSEGRKNKEQAMRNNREKKLEKQLTNLQNQIQKGRENNPVKIEQRIGRIKERFGKVSQYYAITYTHQEFSYTLPEDVKISKRISNSLVKLKEKADGNTITFPALEKKLAVIQEKYAFDFDKIKMHLIAPALIWGPIEEIREKEAGLDGNYLLKTNRTDLNADEIWKLYVTLTRIENAFGDLKSYLGLRPNRHHREDRVDGHIFITILAYHLLHSIEYMLRVKGVHSRWATIKRVVSTHNYSTVQLPTTAGPVINIRKPDIAEGIHMEIYDKLDVGYKHLPVRRNLA